MFSFSLPFHTGSLHENLLKTFTKEKKKKKSIKNYSCKSEDAFSYKCYKKLKAFNVFII